MAPSERITDRLPQEQARNRGGVGLFGKPGAGESAVGPAGPLPRSPVGIRLVPCSFPWLFPPSPSSPGRAAREVLENHHVGPRAPHDEGSTRGEVRSYEPGRPRERSGARGVPLGSIVAGPGGAALAVKRAPQGKDRRGLQLPWPRALVLSVGGAAVEPAPTPSGEQGNLARHSRSQTEPETASVTLQASAWGCLWQRPSRMFMARRSSVRSARSTA
jgi:hypothetical protein